jgi:hypothetical protein
MEKRDDIKFQTFNLSKDKVTVEQVADICKKVNSKVKIVKTEDKIPNSGYALSNKKLLSKGFKFLYGLEESIQEMISKCSRFFVIFCLDHFEIIS